MKLAVIDNNEFYRNYLRMILPLLNGVTEVREAPYDPDAFGDILAFKPDVVICDPCLDNQVDLTLCEALKRQDPAPHIIAYLEPAHEHHGETLYRVGVTNVLGKSSGTEYLRYILRQLVQKFGTAGEDTQTIPLAKRAVFGKSGGENMQKASSDQPAIPDNTGRIVTPETRRLGRLGLRKKEEEAQQTERAANSYQRIWAARKKVGISSGHRVKLG